MRSLLALALLSFAQEKKDAPKPIPRIIVFMPLAIVPGATSTVTARGLVLDQASEVKIEGIEGAAVKIKSKGKAAVPKDTDPTVVGDTQMELEVKLPAEAPEGKVTLAAVTPAGSTEPHALLVIPKEKLVPEKEPNGGFAQAQPVEAGQIVQGSISQPKDVDVFKIRGVKGEKWTFEIIAARQGSFLDATLSLYAEGGRLVATRDDDPGSRDATLTVTLAADGVYYLSLIDAHDQGGPSHVYLLHVRREP
jgi:hypothetical protein